MGAKPLTPARIRQILLLSKEGLSNREIAKKMDPPVYKGTVNRYINFVKAAGLDFDILMGMSDEDLDKAFHKGVPAYADERMDDFFDFLDFFKRIRDGGMSVSQMWDSYRHLCIKRGKEYYSITQFRFHLMNAGLLPTKDLQKLVTPVKGDVSAIVTIQTFETSHIDHETGEVERVHLVIIYVVSSEYICIRHVDKLDISQVLRAIHALLSFLGGVPSTLEASDLLKTCSKPKDLVLSLKSIIKHMQVYYHADGLMGDEKEGLARKHMERFFNYLRHMLALAKSQTGGDILSTVNTSKERYNRTQIRRDALSREEDFIRNERPSLRPLPSTSFEAGKVSAHKVYVDGTIQVGRGRDTGYYSVPVPYIGKEVKCVHGAKELLIMDSMGYITAHTWVDNHGYSLKDEHIAEWEKSKYNDLKTLECKAFNISPTISSWVSQFFKMAPEQGLHIQECIRKYDSIERWALKDPALMSSFCELCIQNNTYNYKAFIGGFYTYQNSYYKDKALNNNFLNNK